MKKKFNRKKAISRINAHKNRTVFDNFFVKDSLDFFGVMGKRKISSNAAGITFYFFLSSIPFTVLLCSLLPMTGITEEDFIASLSELVPSNLHSLVQNVVDEAFNLHVAVFSVSLLTLIWASAKVVMATIRALDQIYQVKDNRNYFSVAGNAVLYTVLSIVGSGILIYLAVKSRTAAELIDALFPSKELIDAFVKTGHNLALQLGLVLIVALLYTFFPAGKRNYLKQLPGAVIASVGISGVSLYVAAYNDRRNIYSSFYGSLAELAILMIWMYFCVTLFLWGAAVNEYFKNRLPGGKKGQSSEEKDEN